MAAKLPKELQMLKSKVTSAVQDKVKRIKFVRQVETLVTEKKETLLRLRDKLSFVFGVVNIALTAFLFGRFPEWMPLFFTVKFFVLIGSRLFVYRSRRWHYFLLDFCYFVNILVLFYVHFFPNSHLLFAICFSFSNGPLAWAIIAWRNSMVFHSLDKMTSIFIHLSPPMVTYTLRWVHAAEKYTICPNISGPLINGVGPSGEQCELSFWDAYFIPILPYIFWQVAYLLKVEVVSKHKVVEKGYMTSFKYMAQDPNSLVSKWGTRIESNPRLNSLSNRYKRNNGTDSHHDDHRDDGDATPNTPAPPPSTLPKGESLIKLFVFLGMQLLYTLLTLLPVWFMFHNFWFHTITLAVILLVSVWNGANFYIDVFSKRYIQSLQDAVNRANLGSARSKSNGHLSTPPLEPVDPSPNNSEPTILSAVSEPTMQSLLSDSSDKTHTD